MQERLAKPFAPHRVVGLTGGIACGKSAAAAAFVRLGLPVIDADQVAREVVMPGTPALREIAETFGDGVLTHDGSLDRKALADIVFRDNAARVKLNAITHPRIAARSMELFQELGGEAPYLIYEASLLVENGTYKRFDALVVVTASVDTQRKRLMARDGLDWAAAQARLDSQLPLADKVAVADFVIVNDDGPDELEQRVREVHEMLLARLDGSGENPND